MKRFTLQILKDLYDKNELSLRQFIYYVKADESLQKELTNSVGFLKNYPGTILTEYVYCYVNRVESVPKCPICGNKRKFTGHAKDGYKDTCCGKECLHKMFSEIHEGQTVISDNRSAKFKEWEQNLDEVEVTDQFIKENIKYDKFISLLTNENIIKYLRNRFHDSDSLLESYQRIKLNIEEKPQCKLCGKPVKWIGKKSKLYTTFCSNSCSNKYKNMKHE